MKAVYFEMLDFQGKIADNEGFEDFGYVPDLLEKTRELFARNGLPNEDEDIIKLLGREPFYQILVPNDGGYHLRLSNAVGEARHSWIYYNKFSDEASDIFMRAHEETHAVCHLGLRGELEQRIGLPTLSDLWEEDFCDQAGLYAVRKKGIEPHPDNLIPYAERLAGNTPA